MSPVKETYERRLLVVHVLAKHTSVSPSATSWQHAVYDEPGEKACERLEMGCSTHWMP
jgi:hypothetical protein